MKLPSLVLVASCFACAVASNARAADAPAAPASSASPKEHYDKGMIFYNIADWPSAIRELKAAYEGDPSPNNLYTLAQAERLSGDCATAIPTYRSFMRQASGPAAAAAEGFIHVCEGQIKQKEDEAAQKAALAAQAQTAAAAAAPASSAPPPPPAPSKVNTTWYADPLGDTLAVLGVAGLATGTVFLLQYSSASSSAKSAATDKASQAAWSGVPTQGAVGIAGASAGVVLLAGAIWRYVAVGGRKQEQAAPPAVGFSVQQNGFQLSYGSQF